MNNCSICRSIRLWVLLVAFIATSPVVADEALWRESTQRGEVALAAGYLSTAETEFKGALENARHCELEPALIAQSFYRLAVVRHRHGRYVEAESLYRRALVIVDKALLENAHWAEQPGVAIGLYSFATLYYRQGRYAEAEPLYQRSLSIRGKALGPECPSHPE